MSSPTGQFADLPALNQVTVPDLWQQQAVTALRAGKDVVVQAPTGAGKTLVFELWSNGGKNRGQAIYTVPTRALANDKLAEWRARGWDVGIATGDLAENLHAPILVATLETQKNRLIQGDGPTLLVVDEYQMIGDADRGLNYELALALAPPQTQLLLLSGSVANPEAVVRWLTRLGRNAVLIRHEHRPVPLEELHANNLNFHVPSEIQGYWPRLVAKCLAEDLGPILIFAPRRQSTESMAAELARNLPTPNPLLLSQEQKLLVGDHLAKMLKSRIAYHHSGLSYGARAGVIEPLAKAGQLRVVVATMGLAAGINFSLRSVALAAASYRRDHVEQPLRADEILQMFGRAGRRGLDETGFVLVTANELRLLDARPCHLSRSGAVDWSALLSIMTAAAARGRDPFTEAVHTQERLFTTKPIFLGVEESLKNPDVPCGLKTDAERARHVRQNVRELLNSRGEWQKYPPPTEVPLKNVRIFRSTTTNSTEVTQIAETVPSPSPLNGERAGVRGVNNPSQQAANPAPDPITHAAPLIPPLPKGEGWGEGKGVDRDGAPDTTANALPSPSPLNGERAGVRGVNNPSQQAADPAPAPTANAAPFIPPLPKGEGRGEGESSDKISATSQITDHKSQITNLPALSEPAALEKSGTGILCILSETDGLKTYGRSVTVADRLNDDRVIIAKWIRRLTNWNGRQAPLSVWTEQIAPLVEAKLAAQKTPVVRFVNQEHQILAHLSIADLTLRVPVDNYGIALWRPTERDVLHDDCARCSLVPVCRNLTAAAGTALLWRRLSLVDAAGVPTRRGQIVSYFSHGDGLAIAAALEDARYPLDELIYDLANLDAGFRFCGEENRWAGRLAISCHLLFGQQSIPGYLENGVPPKYGAGAEQIVAAVHKNPAAKQGWITDLVGAGDIDRVIIEWRSLLRQIAHAPELDWPRWQELQSRARAILNETESPTLTNLPPLDYTQTKRTDHRLILRRH